MSCKLEVGYCLTGLLSYYSIIKVCKIVMYFSPKYLSYSKIRVKSFMFGNSVGIINF